MPAPQPPADVRAIRQRLQQVLDSPDEDGRVTANAKFGIYAFYDYDGEPVYVGQTSERLRVRVRRHLTNQRTDAVAMNVLDPFEVAEIEMWPLHQFEGRTGGDPEVLTVLKAAEYTVFQKVLGESSFGAVLNEKAIPATDLIELPSSLRARIIPDDLYELRKHPDVRIARRASTIAALARVISERQVAPGLRRTLHVQAQRLESLAARRLEELGEAIPEEGLGEETGDDTE